MTAQCQQDELYRAQAGVALGRLFASSSEVESYINKLRDKVWWQKHYARVRYVEVYDRPSRARFSVGSYYPENFAGKIELRPDALNQRTVLHELAHVLTHARYGPNAHGPHFCRVFLELVALEMGPDPYMQLYIGMERENVNHEPGGAHGRDIGVRYA